MTAGRYVGQSVARREHRPLVTGHGRYVDDVTVAGMAHAAFVRSDVARGTITAIDVEDAQAVPGVFAVYLAADLNTVCGPIHSTLMGPNAPMPPMRALAEGDVRFVGEPVAVVVAESRAVAEDAAEMVVVEVAALPAVVDPVAALTDTENLVHPEKGTNVAQAMPDTGGPDVDAAFAGAAQVVTGRFAQSRGTNVPMEPRGLVASWEPGTGEFTAHVSSQNPHEYHAHFARVLGIDHHRVRVLTDQVGGGFGQKVFVSRDETCVAVAAKLLGRPVKWIEDRRENLIAANQARNEIVDLEVAVDDDGAMVAMKARHVEDVGAYAINSHASASGSMSNFITGPYRIGHLGFSSTSAYTNTVGRAAYRGPWLMETTAREQMVDRVARAIGMDPLEFRRRNTVTAAEFPFSMPGGVPIDRVSLTEVLDQAAEMMDYDGFRVRQAAALSEGRHLGLGISAYIEPSGIAFGALATEQANIRIDAAGKVRIMMGSGDHGQNTATTMRQLVAEYLGCDIDDVTYSQHDTTATPHGSGTAGSRTAVIFGGAAIGASKRLREKVAEIAAHLLEASPDDIEIVGSEAFVAGTPSRSVGFAEIAAAAYLAPDRLPPGVEPGLEAVHRYRPPSLFTLSNSCHMCTVEVDAATGMVTFDRYVVSEDCGPMINPTVVEGQIVGGVVQGIGTALYENMAYDPDGNPLASTFLDYVLPGAAEMPEIEIGHIESPSASEGGFKGVGEGGTIGAIACVANAVNDAIAPLGAHIDRLPMGPSEVLAAIDSAGGA
ncbi:MAG: xanthine dehydrogenase family protein molybdopterin-binding subunit [Acidimicrobiales bacterium]